MQGPLWSQPEVDRLVELVGDFPWPDVVSRYNKWARATGHPVRSSNALTCKANRLGAARIPVGRWITLALIHNTLGISHNCPARWVKRWPDILHPSQPNDDTNGRIYIRRDNLRRFARLHPEQFGGVPQSNLLMLLEDEPL
ncbi:MAG: hypothetical protein VKI63_04300, partial [Cyanobium sp.]|nr:hypothetical protein [Cyanobium sp.]